MNYITRRKFLQAGAATPLLGINMFSSQNRSTKEPFLPDGSLHLLSDGLLHSPLEYAQILLTLAQRGGVKEDDYSREGSVAELEVAFAKLLGKESAIFMPTGTLANHLALRALAGRRSRVLVQSESHIYNDSGDCAQVLSNLNLIPLAEDKATFTLKQVKQIFDKTAGGRVATDIGVISIETPVRRKNGEVFELDEMKSICQFARENSINLHLDGARLFMASAYSGITPADYAVQFDTVYVSLYKYFNAASGAILAGPKAIIENMYHTRRMFGGGLPLAWPYAAVAVHYLNGFNDRFKRAIEIAEAAFQQLTQHRKFQIERVPQGSNIYKLHVKNTNLRRLKATLAENKLLIRNPSNEFEGFWLCINESLNQIDAATLVRMFVEAAKAS